MSGQDVEKTWMDFLCFPLGHRESRPRERGLTMVLDKGLGAGETRDLLTVNAPYIDFIKFGFGTSALYSPEVLAKKIDIIKTEEIDVYPGGTFLEVAILQNKLPEFLQVTKKLGFSAVEVSDGTITLPTEIREKAIKMAVEMDFKVLTEIGKKEGDETPDVSVLVEMALRDLECGACLVILEGRESGKGVGLYDHTGTIVENDLRQLVEGIGDPGIIIWETPCKKQQQDMILRFGSNVNLGNIPPHEVMALEALRVGLRADTLKSVCNGNYSPKAAL